MSVFSFVSASRLSSLAQSSTNSSEWLSDDEQPPWQSMAAFFREAEHNIERSLRTRTGLTFADLTLLIALHEVEDGILHAGKTCDRLKWNHPRALLHISRLERCGFTHTEDYSKDPDPDYIVVLTGVGRHVLAEAVPDYIDTVREEAISPLVSKDREVMLRCLQMVLGRKQAPTPRQ